MHRSSPSLSRILPLVLMLASGLRTAAADGFHYRFDFDGIADTVALLAHHYGDQQYVVDTLVIDSKGRAEASADTMLPSGMYLFVFPSLANKYFEFIVDEPSFRVTGDVDDLQHTLEFKGSVENRVFYEDLRFLAVQREIADPLNERLQEMEPGSADYGEIRARLEELDELVRNHREAMIAEHPELLYTTMVHAMMDIEVPDPPERADGSVDSFFAYRYVRDHGLDPLDWSDARLVRTPAVHQVIHHYLNYYTYKHPDSIIRSVDRILERAKASDEMFKYCLIWCLNEYANSKVMGMDAVYVHLGLNYYDKGAAPWLKETQLARIVRQARDMQHTLIGKTARDIRLKDIHGTTRNLYDLDSDYTILYFWDPDCHHCQEETPVLKEAYDVLKATYDIEVFAVNTQLEIEKWLKFIDKHHLDGWHHLADFDHQGTFRNFYNIEATPVLYLLDRDKKIIAKRLVAGQLAEFLAAYESKERGNGARKP